MQCQSHEPHTKDCLQYCTSVIITCLEKPINPFQATVSGGDAEAMSLIEVLQLWQRF